MAGVHEALFDAVARGQPRVVRRLIRAGADVNARNADQETPLMVLLKRPWLRDRHERILKTLLQAGADVEATDKRGYTALCYAAMYGHPRAARLLLRAGADPARSGPDGGVPVLYALHIHHYLSQENAEFFAHVYEQRIHDHPLVKALGTVKGALVARYRDCEKQLYLSRQLELSDEEKQRIEVMEREREKRERSQRRIRPATRTRRRNRTP